MRSMTTIYGIRNCDTMKRAFAWLKDHGVEYTFHDYKKSGVTTDGWTYPDYFHYDYTPPEEGWVVHNAGGPETQVLTIVCQP